MQYGKLSIIFLATIASENDGTTNCQIANYILDNIADVRGYNISELAKCCHVANSSISRFCREIGLDDFSELKELINDDLSVFPIYSNKGTVKERSVEFSLNTIDSLQKVLETLDYDIVEELIRDIYKFDNIATFGLLKAQSVAMNFQGDLLMLGKVLTSKVQFKQQLEYIREADENDLIIIFSYTGIYFDYWYPKRMPKYNSKPKIYFITSDKTAKESELFHRVIYFESLQDYASHPFQLQLVASIIAQNYAHYIKVNSQI